MGMITVNTDRTDMAIDFEAAVIQLSDCLPEARYTHIISSVDSKIE